MRKSGILMHISSLPSDYGIGTMGKEAYKFVDFLKSAKQKCWQILPIGPTSYGDSPYQSFSTNAGNPYFIDMDILREEGLLKKSDYSKLDWGKDRKNVDYETIYENRFKVLKIAFEEFKKGDLSEFYDFLQKNERWISNYALFMSIKNENDGKSWLEWEDGLRKRDSHSLWEFKSSHEDDVMFWEFVQFKFFEQWNKLKKYANDNGVSIIGDIPIYVALDSAEVWVYPDLFELDENLVPKAVAGCPPDAFSPTGQLWGNPLYNWDRHRECGFNWWIDRIKSATSLYDVVRIDHFRGFEGYYSIPYGDKTAENGQWLKGPGIELFNAVKNELGDLPIIAENLGFLTEDVHKLFGMVLQDTWLFEGTVRENLVYNLPDVTDEQLNRVCCACGLDKFVRSLPNGFDTVLSESTSISAGQKQLLTIARAMLQNAPMLILDEATSSVDTRTELLIQRAMDKLTENRTSFVIAHRLSTIKNADLILVMKDGDIIESGTHETLMQRNGFYAALYNSQFEQAS